MQLPSTHPSAHAPRFPSVPRLSCAQGCKYSKAVTLLLRGANDYMLDEMDRSIHDSLCVVKRVLESGSVVPGEQGWADLGNG